MMRMLDKLQNGKGASGEMPLKSLSTDGIEGHTMSDPIDQQAAIDELRKCRFVVDAIEKITKLPSAQQEIIYCKDCLKHNKGYGYYIDGTVTGIKDCCPLVAIRGMAQGHEFDYQYCAYAERKTDE